MATLSELITARDDTPPPPPPQQGTPHHPDELLAESAPPDSALGQAADNLFVSWNQLVLDLSARSGFTPPSLEHIKEVAECAIRQLKDSCQELTGEFAKVGLEWRLAHPDEALAEAMNLCRSLQDLANYDQAILRQETLIGRAADTLQRRLGDFANESSQGF
uniref:Phasin domain-containing protein n=1 Tax=Ascaris lumbricoides TaxID=6252 RepID=A0A9J2Q8S0_ASCLU